MKRFSLIVGILCLPVTAFSAQVWQSTFDASADGVVDIFNNNSGKVMIGPAAGGRLQITSSDNSTNAYTPDKAGRPLGSTKGGSDSFSGLYRFNWSQLNEVETQAFEAVGFLSPTASPQTRQIVGAVLRHWKPTGSNEYYVGVDVAFGTVGITGFGYQSSGSIYIGTNPTANDYQLAIGYDGATKVLSLGLYDAIGNLIVANSANLVGLTNAGEVGAMSVNHLGWSDYTGNGGDRLSVWQVDSLQYFDTANGAALAVVPEPASMLLLAGGAMLALRRRYA